jgi:hypothetical protein
MMMKLLPFLTILVFLGFGPKNCSSKNTELKISSLESKIRQAELKATSNSIDLTVFENSKKVDLAEKRSLIGVYYMPSWNLSADPNNDIDSFWSCLTGRENCGHTNNTAIWGPKGRIYNARFPYEGPFLERKPHPSLKGFYKRDDPQVAKKQLEYMKSYGIDFFAYDWFFGRHYYYHLNFAPQANTYYPKGWKTDPSRDGRVEVPGIEQWNEQLTTLLNENEKLPEDRQMKWAINWVDDSEDRWRNWLDLGSPESLAAGRNYKGEVPDKQLYLKVHDKITQLWIDKYFHRKDYLKDDTGRPIVYLHFPQDLESRASFYGISMKELLDRSKELAHKSGFKGIKFIAVAGGPMSQREKQYGLPTKWVAANAREVWRGGNYTDKLLFQDYVPRLKGMGFEGMTAYINHSFMDKDNKSYADMRANYRSHWVKWSEMFKNDSNFEYQIPVAMGWDMRPMGGTWPQQTGFPSEPIKDNVHSTKSTFKAKLLEAQKFSEKYRETNGNTVMVCCWNEYLEGNYIEPTEGHGFDYLEAIKEVFAKEK